MNKTLLIVVFIFQFISIKAQDLTVKGDNFLYVDNTVLFVNDGIDLQDEQTESLDPNMGDDGGDTNGSNIYLRNGSQLIQGNNNSTNTGNGNVSIIVAGTANKWSYNYWSSPVAASNSNTYYLSQIDQPLTRDGNMIPKGLSFKSINSRNVSFHSDWNSVLGENELTISSRWLFKLEESDKWVSLDPNNTPINAGYGFAMKGLGDKDNDASFHPYEFRGKPNNGDIEIPLNYTPTDINENYILIGNPYPSLLDLRKFANDPANLGLIESFHFWQAGEDKSHYFSESEGGYATMTIAADGHYTPGQATMYKLLGNGGLGESGNQTTPKEPRPLLPIGQGFMIKLKNSVVSSDKLVFKNSHRVFKPRLGDSGKGSSENETGDFFRPGKDVKDDENQNSFVSTGHSQFRMRLEFNDQYIRPLVMTFHDDLTDDFDLGYEAKPIMISGNDGFWGTLENPQIFQANRFDLNLTLPLFFNIKSQQHIELSIYDLKNLSDETEIFLHDTYTGLFTNLRLQNFTTTLDKGIYEDRFEITFKENSILDQNDFEANNFKIVSDNHNKKIIVYNPKLKSVKIIKLFDMSGKEVSRLNINSTKNSFEINTSEISNGVFIAKIESTENISCSKRVIINK